MLEEPQLTVASDLAHIHQVITRALGVAIENSRIFSEEEHIDAAQREGLLVYIKSLVQLLDSHHLIEDELIFPYFREKISSMPVDTMVDQHQSLLTVLEILSQELQAATDNVTDRQVLKSLQSTLEKVQEIWLPHYQLEETYLTEDNISSVIDQTEQTRLCHSFAEASKKHIKEDYFVLPFVFYNLPEQERKIMAKVFPPIVSEQLIPIVWKEKWQIMSPFFLL